ncbi:tetratricopeptide repeat protein [Simiduia curdlanivorans]|uniref:Tetratricopeptide repeat protein n=1 Tax=Simiduia curdlanivorans TaxID=1492769 RepID=A0ABV8V088_9GAMM|nr:tetratricopeptide repeat protein [Simiduia curdlanivorans]MDN3638063.1 tetratricopeptide repeat protein [Simiduia curdlanivorans]
MRCVNYSRVLLVIAFLLLAGCNTAPVEKKDAQQREVELPVVDPSAIVTRVPSPNPYDQLAEPNDPEVRAIFEKANGLMAKQQWASAEALLLQAIAQAPSYAGLYYNLGRVYQKLNRPEDAEAQYRNAIGLNSQHIYAYNALAQLKREAGAFDEAEALYQQALAVWPDHADSYKNLGILYDLYMGKLQEALVQYKNYQALQPEPDRLMAAWIIDLERRLPAEPASETAPVESTEEVSAE